MTALIIGDQERAVIAELKAFASANLFDARAAIEAATSNEAVYREMMRSLSITLPVAYVVTFSHERQPFGIARHISISLDVPNKMPGVAAVEFILREFGMKPLAESAGVWVEDVSPGLRAVNVVQPLEIANG
jgi:hypothetical protein